MYVYMYVYMYIYKPSGDATDQPASPHSQARRASVAGAPAWLAVDVET